MDEFIVNPMLMHGGEAITFTLERNPTVFSISREVLNDLNGSNAVGADLMTEFERAAEHIARAAARAVPDEYGRVAITLAMLER